MKSIEKDRTRRYESVDALAADVQRHLNHEPVLAGSPGLAYRMKKFVLKHRAPLAATAGIIVVVSIGLIFAIMFIRADAKRQRDKKAITTKIVDRELLWEAQKLYDQGRYRRGLSKVAAILGSKTVGYKARLLYARLFRPEPADGADVGVKPQVRLGWTDGLYVASYKVYFGTSPDDLVLRCQVQEDCYATSPRLQSHKWYCWRVDAVKFDGSVIEGEPYSFSTGNMIAWWKFDQTEDRMLDSSGNALHGRLLADAHIITDPLRGSVLSLDGNRDCVRFGTDDRFSITSPIDYLTPVMNPSNEGDKSKFVGVLPDMSKLVDGTNVLAVEIHRARGGSSDSGLSLSLTAATQKNKNKLIPWGSTWKYLDDGSDQGTVWYDPNFDDSSWASGPAELGHEHDSELEATVISWGTDDNERHNERHVTHYFRHYFNVPDASNYQCLHLEIERDDGAIVYLNGKEVYRNNMPSGKVTYMTRSLYTVSSGDFFCSSYIDAGNLVDGTNVLAVEIHQRLGGSGDISFDLNLAGLTDFSTLVSPDAVWKYRDDDSDQGAPWYSGGFDDSGWARGSMYRASGYKNDTTYFRHSFEVPDASIYKALALGITSDDGTVIYLNGTEIATTNMPCGSMTVAMWVKAQPFDKRYHVVISKGEAWNLNLLNMKDGTALFNFKYTGVIGSGSHQKNAITANATIESGNWYHLTAVHDGTRMHLYVNGRLENSGRAFGAIVDNEYPVVVGENWENVYHEFNGLIDDVRIYRYALSDAEVEALYVGHGPGPIERPRWVVNIAH